MCHIISFLVVDTSTPLRVFIFTLCLPRVRALQNLMGRSITILMSHLGNLVYPRASPKICGLYDAVVRLETNTD